MTPARPRVRWSPVRHGDLDRIAVHDIGVEPSPHFFWTELSIDVCGDRYRQPPRPGRDCVACPGARAEHDSWGCPRTGCSLSIALITTVEKGRT